MQCSSSALVQKKDEESSHFVMFVCNHLFAASSLVSGFHRLSIGSGGSELCNTLYQHLYGMKCQLHFVPPVSSAASSLGFSLATAVSWSRS